MMDFNDLKQLDSLPKEEREAVLKILKQLSSNGSSELLDKLKYADYKEIPVDIETFLHNKKYLGNALYDANGRFTVFPYWEKKLKEIFPDNTTTAYNTIILTGAIGLGKSTIAVICLLYMLHRLLCLNDPYLYYGLQPIDKITISLMNITIDNAKGVALDKMNQMILQSEWFMAHGEMHGTTNLEYVPDKHIELITASSNNQVIGRAVFCLDGDTLIMTTNGEHKLKDLVDKDIEVYSIDNSGELVISDTCTVSPTLVSDEEYEITLEDGSIIKCTPNHRLMLKDGTYKEAQYLTEEDELFDYNISYDKFIQNIIDTRGQWNIPNDEYFEVHHIVPRCLGGEGRIKIGRQRQEHPNLIYLYAEEHFIAHKLLALENPTNKSLVYAWSRMAFPKGKCKRDFPITPEEYANLRKLQSKIKKGVPLTESAKKKLSELNKGKHLSDEIKQKISESNKNKVVSKETRQKMSDAVKKRYKEHPESFVSNNKDKIAVNNGTSCKYIDKDEPLPDGYVYGQCKHKTYNIKDREIYCKQKSEITKGEKNPMYNKGYKLSGGNNGKAIYVYTYLGIDYQCRDDLIKVLQIDYPDISESTIRRIMKGNYSIRTSSKYQYVIDNLSWRLKDKYKNNI